MSDPTKASEIVAKPVDAGHSPERRGFKPKISVRISLIVAVLPMLLVCNVATAQVTGLATPPPIIDATSPLGMGPDSAVGPTGIALGSTEIVSPGISPAPADATGTVTSSGSTCSTLGSAPSSMFGSTSSFDGGGMPLGTAPPAEPAGISMSSGRPPTSGMLETSGMSGMCGSGSASIASSSTPMSTPTSTSPVVPGGVARTGIPLASTEIAGPGVSAGAAVPITSAIPDTMAVTTVTSPPAGSSSTMSP
jgi:hypothetical protein